MKFLNNKSFTIIIFSFFFSFVLSAQASANSNQIINYYGILASDLDSNMSKMTSDLYFTQLCEISTLSVNDYRSSNSENNLDENNINFIKENLNLYFKVNKIENSTRWLLSIFLINNTNQKTYSEQKEYDSFYKILMEPKTSLQDSLKKLIYNQNEYIVQSTQLEKASYGEFNGKQKNLSTEEFSGTWTGENYIDKIVILRGGRGFVIFNNGASMNISVKIEENNKSDFLIITQTSRTNASFYPNLDRQLALNSANTAEPIEWSFKVIDSNTLSGTKKTLIQSIDGKSVEQGEEAVIWNRKS